MRVIVMELARIADHLVCNSVIGVDTGALTGFTYMFQEREKIYELYEEICGARLTTNLGRIGGFERDFSPTFHTKLNKFLAEFPDQFRGI
jgi:NADH-quinone oxidoreductase subunit D